MRISNAARMEAGENIQKAADACSARDFAEYVRADAQTAGKMREKFAILRYFDDAFSKTAEWIKNGKPRCGEVQLGLVYNMGYVVKTPTLTFAIDLCHPRAAEIADNLDFVLITHNHQDHLSQPLINTLKKAGKPIVQNYMDTPHYSAGNRRFKFGEATILTKCCDHNRRLERFVLTYEIDCGKSAGSAHFPHGRRLRYKTGRSGARTGRIHSAPRSGIGHSKVRNTNHKTENHIDVAYTRTRA